MPGRFDKARLERGRRSLLRRDPRLGRLIRSVGLCGLVSRGDPYGALLRSILGQQLAGAAVRSIDARFRASFGGRYPKPEVLLAARKPKLRTVGLSGAKIEAMRGVARAFESGQLSARRLYRMSDADVIEAVTAIKGIGPWTAHMLLMFSLARPDVLPVGDYGVRKGAQVLYALPDLPNPAALHELAVRWNPHRSIAAWYLWRAADQARPLPEPKRSTRASGRSGRPRRPAR
jgi:DNA-3-methyladenine glycosylase II